MQRLFFPTSCLILAMTGAMPAFGQERIMDIATVNNERELVIAEGSFIRPGVIYTVNLEKRWRRTRFDLTKGISSLDGAPARNEVLSSCWDTSVRLHSLPSLQPRVTISVDRSACRAGISPDGKTVVVVVEGFADKDVSGGRMVALYDAETGAQTRVLSTDLMRGFDAKFSPNGKDVAVCGGLFEKPTGEILIWNASTGELKGRAKSRAALRKMAYSDNGQWIVAVGAAGTIVVDSETGREIASNQISGNALQILPGRNQVVLSHPLGLVVTDLPQMETVKLIETEQGPIGGLAALKNGDQLVVAGAESTRIWDTRKWTSTELLLGRVPVVTGRLVAQMPNVVPSNDTRSNKRDLPTNDKPEVPSASSMLLIANGNKLYLVDAGTMTTWNSKTFPADIVQMRAHATEPSIGLVLSDGNMQLLDAATGDLEAVGRAPSSSQRVLTPDLAACVYVAVDGQPVYRQIGTDVERRATEKLSAAVTSLSVADDSICCALSTGDVVIFNADLSRKVQTIPEAALGGIAGVDWSDSRQRLAVAESTGRVSVWDVDSKRSPRLLKREATGKRAATICFSKSGDEVAIGHASGQISIVSAHASQPVSTFEPNSPSPVRSIAWGSRDSELHSTNAEGLLRRIPLAPRRTAAVHQQVAEKGEQIRSACFSHDAEDCYIGFGRRIEVRSTATWQLKGELQGHRDTIRRIRVSPDGMMMASASDDRILQIRKKAHQGSLWEIDRTLFLSQPAHRLAWSPDGKQLIVGLTVPKILVYEAGTWEMMSELPVPYIPNTLSYSGDGKRFVSAGINTGEPADPCEIQIWDPSAWKVLKTVKGHRHGVEAIAVSRDGGEFYSTAADGALLVWSTAAGTSRMIRALPQSGTSLAPLKDPRYAVVAWHFAELGVLDLGDGSVVKELDGYADANEAVMQDVVVSDDGRWAVSCALDNRGQGAGCIKLWRLDVGGIR